MSQQVDRRVVAGIAHREFAKDVARFGVIGAFALGALAGFFALLPGLTPSLRGVLVQAVVGVAGLSPLIGFAKARARIPTGRPFEQRWFATALLLSGAVLGGLSGLLAPMAPEPNVKLMVLGPLAHLMLALGVALIPCRSESGHNKVRAGMDGLLVVLAMAVLGWSYVIGPAVFTMSRAAPVFGMLVPLLGADLALVAATVAFFQRGALDTNRSAIWIASLLAFCLCLASAGTLSWCLLAGLPGTTLLDAGLAVGYGLSGLLAFVVRFGPARSKEVGFRLPNLFQSAMPFLALPIVLATVLHLVVASSDRRLLFGAIVCSAVTVAAVLVRQLTSIMETRALFDGLNTAYRRLEAQTDEIEAQNEELTQVNQELDSTSRRLSEANVLLSRLATTDPLTGLANRRSLQIAFRSGVDECRRLGVPMAVAMIDVDHFKRYNDTFGHAAGDQALQVVAEAIKRSVRAADQPARYGGEEFSVLLPGADSGEARTVAERIRAGVTQAEAPGQRLTVSIGLAVLSPTDPRDPSIAFVDADAALYRAKESGRNRVVLSGDPEPSGETSPEEPTRLAVESAVASSGLAAAIGAATTFIPLRTHRERVSENLTALLSTLELRDAETQGHGERVMWSTLLLATAMADRGKLRMDLETVRSLALGALLHDIGKIGVTDLVLHKPHGLDEVEQGLMRRHPILGARLVERFEGLAEALTIVRNHHERWDGTGYPDGLSGEEIPLTARIFAVCDAFDAMSSFRAYQAAMPCSSVRTELIAGSETQFDPEVILAFLSLQPVGFERIAKGDVDWIMAEVRRRVSETLPVSA